jgi:hypothetical protein
MTHYTSILATRADYVSDVNEKSVLLRQAYALADASRDNPNLKEIAHSLAELYIENLKDSSEGQIWIERLRDNLISSSDKDLHDEVKRLQKSLDQLTAS